MMGSEAEKVSGRFGAAGGEGRDRTRGAAKALIAAAVLLAGFDTASAQELPAAAPAEFPVPANLPSEDGAWIGLSDGRWLRLEPLRNPQQQFCLRRTPPPIPSESFGAVVRYWAGGGPGENGATFRQMHLDEAAFMALPEVDPALISIFYFQGDERLTFLEALARPTDLAGLDTRRDEPDLRFHRTGPAGCANASAENDLLLNPALYRGAIGAFCGQMADSTMRPQWVSLRQRLHFRLPLVPGDPMRSRVTATRRTCGSEAPQQLERIGVILHSSGHFYGYRFTDVVPGDAPGLVAD